MPSKEEEEEEERYEVSMRNPFNIQLTECQIRIDGTGLKFTANPINCGFVIFLDLK